MKFLVQGPFWPPLSPGDGRNGPTGFQNTSTQCVWVGCIHIMRLGPLPDLYCTPGPSKGPVLAPRGPFGGPGGPRRAPGDQIWSQRSPIGPTGLESWSPHTLAWYWASSGSPGAPKGPVLAPKGPIWGQNSKLSQTYRVTYQNLREKGTQPMKKTLS